jgi:hypothetical protein
VRVVGGALGGQQPPTAGSAAICSTVWPSVVVTTTFGPFGGGTCSGVRPLLPVVTIATISTTHAITGHSVCFLAGKRLSSSPDRAPDARTVGRSGPSVAGLIRIRRIPVHGNADTRGPAPLREVDD